MLVPRDGPLRHAAKQERRAEPATGDLSGSGARSEHDEAADTEHKGTSSNPYCTRPTVDREHLN